MKTKIQFKLTILALAALSASALSIPGGGQQPKFEGAGLYYGLVDGATFENSGYVNVVISGKSVVTISIKIGAEKSSLKGTVDETTKQFVPADVTKNPMGVAFSLISNPGELTRADGTLTVNGTSVTFSAPVLTKNPVGANVPAVGKFTAVFDGIIGAAALDTTAGTAKLRVLPGGKLKVEPTMADGRVLPFVTQIAADGSARFWRSISKTGALTGTLQFSNDPMATMDLSGSVDWFKPARNDAKYYPEAFNAALTLVGSRYVKSAPILDFAASTGVGILTTDLSEYTAPIVVEGTLDNHNKFAIVGDGSVKLGFNQGVGLALGSAKDSTGAKGILIGVVLQKQNVARGIVFGGSATGEFQLVVKP